MMTQPAPAPARSAPATLDDLCDRLDRQNELLAQLVDVFVKYEPTLAALEARVSKPKLWGGKKASE